MADDDTELISIPGAKFEKAAADVSSAAGKSLIKGVAMLLGASVSGYVARKRAKAKAIETEIRTATEIAKEKALTKARRENQVEEVQHAASLEMARRRAQRMIVEMAREQQNLEAILAKGIDVIEQNPSAEASDLDEDWLFRFAHYAQTISEETVQNMWARILASAATKSRPQVSAATLFTLSLVDAKAATQFIRFHEIYEAVGDFPADIYSPGTMNLLLLEELGLIRRVQRHAPYEFKGFVLLVNEGQDANLQIYEPTARGSEILEAAIKDGGYKRLDISLAGYVVANFISRIVTENRSILLRPKRLTGQGAPMSIRFRVEGVRRSSPVRMAYITLRTSGSATRAVRTGDQLVTSSGRTFTKKRLHQTKIEPRNLTRRYFVDEELIAILDPIFVFVIRELMKYHRVFLEAIDEEENRPVASTPHVSRKRDR